jgi:hypothetical protein
MAPDDPETPIRRGGHPEEPAEGSPDVPEDDGGAETAG